MVYVVLFVLPYSRTAVSVVPRLTCSSILVRRTYQIFYHTSNPARNQTPRLQEQLTKSNNQVPGTTVPGTRTSGLYQASINDAWNAPETGIRHTGTDVKSETIHDGTSTKNGLSQQRTPTQPTV